MENIPKPGKEVAKELPGATDNVKQFKGSFLLWVLTVGSFVISILGWGLYLTNKGRISDKDEENENCRLENARLNKELKDWQTIVVPGLKQVAPQVAETKEKLDSIINNN